MRTSNFNKERLNSIASIKAVEAKPKENRGSLLGLFSSQYFTIDMAMIYLYKKKKEAGIHDFLVNKLYEYSDYEIDFYIPQLCYILIKTRSAGLERFLLDKCTKNISHFLKILWYLNSYGQAEIKNKKGYMYVESVTTKAEMAMVNGPTHGKLMIDTFGIPVNKKLSLTDEELDEMRIVSERKRSRIEYLSDTLRLINILVSISLKLKATEAEDRKPLLKSYIKRINVWLNYMRKKHSRDQDEYFKKLFHGILLPFSSDEKDNSTQLVRIIEDEIICFNTKKRAPYRIVIETIDMNEIKYIGSQAVPEHLADKALQNSPTPSLKSIKSLKALEEDDWDDLISAKFTRESSPTLTFADLSSKEKYRDLVDFGKIAKKAEAELKDTSMLKDVDLVQKYEVYRTRSGRYTQYLPPPSRGMTMMGKQNQINLFDVIEESKTPESRTPERKVSSDLVHHQNRKRFDKVFPRKRTLERRQSFSTLEPKQKPKKQRRLSVRRLRGTELIQCLDKFKENHLPKRLLSVYTKILEKLKQETLERAKSLVAKGLASRVSRVITNVTGWGPWEELWEYKEQSIKKKSPFGQFKSYKLRSIVIKANDDLRQEVLIMQIIKKIQTIWKEAGLNLALRTYDILVTSNSSGIIEFVRDTMSLDGIKKKNPGKSLLQFFVETFKYDFEEAQKNFMDSLAAYSLICFLLQIKDRHNGNILLDAHGHIIHIDFGFVLTMSPGGINFESAPFKLTHEYVELMGGINSATFHYFKMQLIKGFLELRKHVDSLAYILQVMMEGSDLPCFHKFQISPFRDRFKERSTDNEAIEFVEKLIDNSYDNWRTVQYDNFQKYTNGILP